MAVRIHEEMQSYRRVNQQDYGGSSDDLQGESAEFFSDFKRNIGEEDRASLRHARRQPSSCKIALLIAGALVVGTLGLWRFASLAIEMLSLDQMPDPPQKALVIASYRKQNTTWLDEIPDEYAPSTSSPI